MTVIELMTALLLLVVLLALVARQVHTPVPILNAIAGLLLGLLWHTLPGLPRLDLPPELVLSAVLPPLLASASFSVPLGAFRANLRPITLLAVGLVGLTMAAAATAVHIILPGLEWAAAFALGAVVAPPDPVAATTVGGRLGLRNQLVTILEGEGLVNDATAFALYGLAVEAMRTGKFGWGHVALELLIAAPLGIGVGLAIGWPAARLRGRMENPVIESALSIVVPYAAYLIAERVGGSPILSVVALGFYLRRRSTAIGTPQTRLTLRTVWRTLDFIIGGIVFMFVGVGLGEITSDANLTWRFALPALTVAGVVIVARMVWMLFAPEVVRLVSGGRVPAVASWRERLVLGWAGMRGVVSLALALAIPATTIGGDPVARRGELVLLAFSVIAGTLLVQGLTLAPLIRWLGVGQPGARERQEREARSRAEDAARACLDRLTREDRLRSDEHEIAERWLTHSAGLEREPMDGRLRNAMRESLDAARMTLLEMRDRGEVAEDIADELEDALDLDEVQLAATPRTREVDEADTHVA